mmetsp:Transcript_746/g.1524  ORF Transcript_746/g.1524 Transcript_746/m.1524 type:complete len:689 (-) Transcript_746:190-2256(-)|eukprot:CAMPEP_0113313714 /NCGR_PEP_ID=MMETSP0010_2-20120614/10032_1 /TAXON_ID=216773 ORGANISM="Corethron hystrix, Strain 308" /NCGR_SAMPLE_ID=MMETSP0010_2 /ASSEMBLY_ACC=CAM_ASM_000155 /LENGTH=688 /DNA_ID=CAMNT_0000169791 /DNA_START=87 /DNA_END=2153 /DNA_ORIENTATION=- /assembly_acc=CAM_ASM_000155
MKLVSSLPPLFCCFVSFARSMTVDRGFNGMKDRVITLGRGYSPAAGTLHSTCLRSSEPDTAVRSTIPSFDYEYFFHSFRHSASRISNFTASSAEERDEYNPQRWSDFAFYHRMRTEMEDPTSESRNFMASVIRVQMYYASAREEDTVLVDDARDLLDKGQHVEFLQACGPQYIRTVNRFKELAALFSYTSHLTATTGLQPQGFMESFGDLVNDFSTSRRSPRTSTRMDALLAQEYQDIDHNDVNNTRALIRVSKDAHFSQLRIQIFGFGLALNPDAEGSLNARTWQDLDKVMNYGFQAMANPYTGVVRSVEVIPWTTHIAFHRGMRFDVQIRDMDVCYRETSATCSGKRCMVDNNPTDCQNVCYVQNDNDPYDCRDGASCDPTAMPCYAENTSDVLTFTYAYEQNVNCAHRDPTRALATFAVFDEQYYRTNTEEQMNECPATQDPSIRVEETEFPAFLRQLNLMANAEQIVNMDMVSREAFNANDRLNQCLTVLYSYTDANLDRMFVLNRRNPVRLDRYLDLDPTNGDTTDDIIVREDFTDALGALRLKRLLTGDECLQGNATNCNLCAVNATESVDDCILRPRRYLSGRLLLNAVDYMRHFYRPCMGQLTDSYLGIPGDGMYTRHWTQLDACRDVKCMVQGTTWDNSTNSCVLPTHHTVQGYQPMSAQDLMESYCMPEFRNVEGTVQ